MEKLITTSEAAKVLDLSADSVRKFEREGILSAIKVGKGQRLFAKSEVEKLHAQREKSDSERARQTENRVD